MSLPEPSLPPLDGFVLIDKPAGLTSQQVVGRVKRAVGVRKAGHAGTLDPMATGLLIVGLGRGTRLLGYLSDKDKQYEATIRLGQATVTDDAEGEPVGHRVDATGLTDQAIGAAVERLTGTIEQAPSAVSAIKVAGQRAYALVRAGQAVALAERTVRVDRFVIDGRSDRDGWVDLAVRVDCSTGTYVRALARDLGEDLGVGGHLTSLRRSRVGGFAVADAVGLEAVTPSAVQDLLTMAQAVAPVVGVDLATAQEVGFGRAIALEVADLAAVAWGERLLGLYRRAPDRPGWAQPVAVLVEPRDLVGEVAGG